MNATQLLTDPSASTWLKTALSQALERDALDAAVDSAVLAKLLETRCNDMFSSHDATVRFSAACYGAKP